MNNFDYRQYINNYPDLQAAGINDIQQAWRHYCLYGIHEGRVYKKITEGVKSKVLIIYVYYYRKNQQKNETNLSFFIKHGLNSSNWNEEYSLTSLFVINGQLCEVVIPTNDCYVLKQDNCSDYEGWLNGIRFMESKIGNKLHEVYEYLILMNAGTCGPFMEPNKKNHWINPFIKKLDQDKAIACSPFMNNWGPDTGHTGLALSCHFTVFRLNPELINLLTCKKQNINGYVNPVLSKKINKLDSIFTGEMGLSKLLLPKITALYSNVGNSSISSDRKEFRHLENDSKLSKTIFIKNIWRISESSYASLPVLYDFCNTFIQKHLRQKNPLNADHNFDLLKVPESGITYHTNFKWTDKKEYHTLHGHAEEHILFPISKKSNGGVVIYTHYHQDSILIDCNLQSIKILMYLGYDIIFYTASGVTNVDLPFEIHQISNTGVGTDWRMLLEGLKLVSNHEWVMFVNDSLILGVNGIYSFQKTIEEQRGSCKDFWGQWFTNHVGTHLIGTPIEFKSNLIPEVIKFIETTLPTCKKDIDYITHLEIGFTQHLLKKGYTLSAVHNDSDFKMGKHGFLEPQTLRQWINHPKTFALKWKYSVSYLNNLVVSEELNYLTRFLYYGPNGTISKGELTNTYIKSKDFVF